jgi:hypothetical protein
MHSFLSKVLEDVLEKGPDLRDFCFVLPNKRSALFLKEELRKILDTNSFFPSILSIEEFMEKLSGYQVLDRIGLLFEFYSVFKLTSDQEDRESFESFSKWAHILLQDFNELDGNLIDPVSVFSYIYEARRVENWTVDGSGQSAMVRNYIAFHKLIPAYYRGLQDRMKELKAGYQGYVYKKACESILDGKQKSSAGTYVFAGFNALSQAEERVMQELLQADRALVYWDDDHFYGLSESSAGSFLSHYRNSWSHFKRNEFKWTENNIDSPKIIHLHGLPKNISQIKHTGNLLKQLNDEGLLSETALILGNEKLLPSLLNSLPEEVSEANITMGYELQNVSLSSFFESLFRLHLNRQSRKDANVYYYKDLNRLFSNPQLRSHCLSDPIFQKDWNRLILKEKAIYLTEKDLFQLTKDKASLQSVFRLLFSNWDQDINAVLAQVGKVIDWLRAENDPDHIETEILFRFHTIFSELLNFNSSYSHLRSLKSLQQFYRQILQLEKMSFQGEPLSGLQIMGLLESRVLDFETVILTSVNEGYLPSGRSDNSFIPLDIKREKNLPTYSEKEAIFSYHFFRLLHRSKRIYLIYNNITDDFGSGEPSRFIKQLEIAKRLGHLNQVSLEKSVYQPVLAQNPLELKTIEKTGEVLSKMRQKSQMGFSPTAFTSYIRNPLDYYKRYVLEIKEHEKVEENMAANTFGTVIHDALEALYRPYLLEFLTPSHLDVMLNKVHREVEAQWSQTYSPRGFRTGKNYLSFEMAKQFIINFLRLEKADIIKGEKIKVLALEEKITCLHPTSALGFEVRLRGTIDRIDEINGIRRIVDYKTGKVATSDMNVRDWEKLITEERYSKAFQVLMYAYMYARENPVMTETSRNFESGIISFKNLRSGFMRVNSQAVDQKRLSDFGGLLDLLLLEMFNPELAFEEKEIKAIYY